MKVMPFLALPVLLVAVLSIFIPAKATAVPAPTPGQTGGLLYIPSAADDVVDIVDIRTHEIIETIETAPDPILVERSADQSKVYVAHFAAEHAHLSVLKVADNTSKDLPVGGFPAILKLSPTGERLYVGELNNQLEVIDTRTDKAIQRLTFTRPPFSLDVSPDGRVLYIAFVDGTAGAYDAFTGQVIHQPVSVGSTVAIPWWGALSVDGSKFYTANGGTHNVTVFDTKTWNIVATIDMGEGNIAATTFNSPDGKLVYATNYVGRTGNIKVIDVLTNTVLRTIETPGPPFSLNFTDDGKQGFLLTGGPNSTDLLGNIVSWRLAPTTSDAPGELYGFDPITEKLTFFRYVSTAPGVAELVSR